MKFQVHNLAKIEDATFEIKDLTIFVGKNSTNKTYVAHTVYMLNKILSKLDDNKYIENLFKDFTNIKVVKELLKEINKLEKKEIIEQVEIEASFDNYSLEELRKVRFNIKEFDINKLTTQINDFLNQWLLNEINKSFNGKSKVLETIDFEINNIITDNIITIDSHTKELDEIFFMFDAFKKVIANFKKQKITQDEFYFPASRTGFILAFDEIVSGVLRDRFGGQPTATKLTEPTIDFISGFSDIKSGKFSDEVDFLTSYVIEEVFGKIEKSSTQKKLDKLFAFIENRIIKGKIVEVKQEQNNYTQFYLQPNDLDKLELHLSSSATVELLPFVIFLKHFSKIEDRLLVIEEPEAHLHPKAQIEMARLIVMLVNAGAKVLVTTHSDYILNEISNCIKLSVSNPKKVNKYLSKHGLSQETIIAKDNVSAYLFKESDIYTEVKKLTIDDYGISNDNFDDVLDELLERTEEINEILGN